MDDLEELSDPKFLKRFWDKVDKRGPDDCWEWQASKVVGYGQIQFMGKRSLAHRLSLAMIDPSGFYTKNYCCHKCDNPSCVNPAHLWWGTPTENALDMFQKSRNNPRSAWLRYVTHCKQGHELSGENLRWINNGEGRQCKACCSMRGRQRTARKQLARQALKG